MLAGAPDLSLSSSVPPTPDSETLAAFAKEIKVQKMLLLFLSLVFIVAFAREIKVQKILLVLLSLLLARMMDKRLLHVVWVRTRLVL